jgi:putative ABC transport system ATP-binding protein
MTVQGPSAMPRRVIRRPRRLAKSVAPPGVRHGSPLPAPGPARMRRHSRSVIDLRGATKIYDTGTIHVPALRGISLVVERGDFVAIMGSSGSGKSTLMNIIGCLDVPTAGDYLIDGVDVRSMDEDDLADLRNRKIGFIFQSFNLVARTSALANVELPLAYAGVPREERRRRAARALAQVGMRDRLHHAPSELSGGQQQRVAVARAIVTNPSLILADEPTGNLDSHSMSDVLGIFRRLHTEGRTVVLITHEPDVAEQARRVIRLADGRVVADDESAPLISTAAAPTQPAPRTGASSK